MTGTPPDAGTTGTPPDAGRTGTPPAIRIIVADDHQVVRTGFAALLDTQPDFTVVGTACDGKEAVRVCRESSPDVVLMDVRMPVLDGIEATRQLAGPGPDGKPGPRILILTTFDLDHYVYDALCAGASGFLLKDTLPTDLLSAIRVVAAGDALLAPSVTRRLIGEFARTGPATGAPATGMVSAEVPAAETPVRDDSAWDDATVRAGVARGGTVPDTAARSPGYGRAGAVGTADQLARVLTDRELEVLTMVARGLSNGEIAERLTISPATAKTHVAHLLTKLDARDRIQLVIIAYRSGLVATAP